MTYKVTPDQYEMLIKARDNWPEGLSYGWKNIFGDKKCVINYLTSMTSLDDREVNDYSSLKIFQEDGLEKLSKIYGLPQEALQTLFIENISSNYFRPKNRSKKVLTEFLNLLEKVKVMPEPIEYQTETYNLSLEEKTEEEYALV